MFVNAKRRTTISSSMLVRSVRFIAITCVDVSKKCDFEWQFIRKQEYKHYLSKYLDRSGIPGNKDEDQERNLLCCILSTSNTGVYGYVDVTNLRNFFSKYGRFPLKHPVYTSHILCTELHVARIRSSTQNQKGWTDQQ